MKDDKAHKDGPDDSTESPPKKRTIFGQDVDMIVAVLANILSWFVRTFVPSLLPRLLPDIDAQDKTNKADDKLPSSPTQCVVIGRPGGMEQLRQITLKPGYVTCGYNVKIDGKSVKGPFVHLAPTEKLTPGMVVIRVHAFSINYADCCIRWGLYESANRFVGWPIVPGFDVAGVVERVGDDCPFQVGDRVFGATFFGAYSTRVLIPHEQLRTIPKDCSMSEVASLPAVSLTAIYALMLGGQYAPSSPDSLIPRNRSILVHSAAGGVGSMMVQMAKVIGMSPVVGVVGRSAKVDAARSLGCDVVIDKSNEDLWSSAHRANPGGYALVADANGVSTLRGSFDHLAPTGRLLIFGFHSNLPMGQDMLSPMEWIRMIIRMFRMPTFDAMDLTASNKSLLGFNLSFFVEESVMLGALFDQVRDWINKGQLKFPRVTSMVGLSQVAEAHLLLHSGTSIGKLVVCTKYCCDEDI